MNERKRSDVTAELDFAIEAERNGDFRLALSHLMKAHGMSQAFRRDHARIHWKLLAFALRRHRLMEAINQFVLALGAATEIKRDRPRARATTASPTKVLRQPSCD